MSGMLDAVKGEGRAGREASKALINLALCSLGERVLLALEPAPLLALPRRCILRGPATFDALLPFKRLL